MSVHQMNAAPEIRMRPNETSRTSAHPVLTLVAINAAGGAAIAVFLVGAILLLDIGQLGTLVAGSDSPVLPVVLLTAGFVVTFSSVAMGTAIMRIGRGEDGSGGGTPVPVPVRATRRRS
jgi:hypothetical protein